MPNAFRPEAFYDSACEFARSALHAHHTENCRRVALDAGTALQHLAKACLARRSPALIAELRNESSVASVIWLLRLDGAKLTPPVKVRTVGLQQALERVGRFVTASAGQEDLQTLTDMRNGIVHAAEDAELEARILAAFVQQADVLISDLGRERQEFWAEQLGFVDALLTDATDKVAHVVALKLAAAKARDAREYLGVTRMQARMMRTALQVSIGATLASDEALMKCPVCKSSGIAAGSYEVEFFATAWDQETGAATDVEGTVWFEAARFSWRVCSLRLDSPAELAEAKVTSRWGIKNANWRDYAPPPWENDRTALMNNAVDARGCARRHQRPRLTRYPRLRRTGGSAHDCSGTRPSTLRGCLSMRTLARAGEDVWLHVRRGTSRRASVC